MTKSDPKGANLPVERWEVAKLVPYALNAKKHPPEQVSQLAASIKRFGWGALIHVDKDGVVIIGHGRRLAAIELGLTHVMVHCRRDLSEAECHALRIADNRIASTDYDQALLQDSMVVIADLGFDDMALTGMSERELEFMLSSKDEMTNAMMVEDVGLAVEEQKLENTAKADAVEKAEAPLAEAFGFKRVSMPAARRIKSFMALIEEETGKQGLEALLAHAEELGA